MRNASMWLAATALLTLSACHKKAEEPVAVENGLNDMNADEQQPVETPPVLEPEPTNNMASAAPPPPPPVPEDQQTLDDADATGLTSRLPDDYDGTGNHGAVAQ